MCFVIVRLAGFFVKSLILMLASTAAAKLVAISMEAPELARAAPLVGFLSLRQLLLVAILTEIITCISCWRCMRVGDARGAVEWIAGLAGVFLAFRIGLWSIDWQAGCYCLGLGASDVYFLNARIGDWLSKFILLWMVLGSYALLFGLGKELNGGRMTTRSACS